MLPVIHEDTLQHGRRFHHQRTIFTQVNIAHGVKNIGIGCCHLGLGIESLLPNGQHVVARTERLFRPNLHAERVDQRQSPKIGLRRALEEQFIAKCLRGLHRGAAINERQFSQFFEAGVLSRRLCLRRRRITGNQRGH